MSMLTFNPLNDYSSSVLRLLKAFEAPHGDARDVGDGKITIGLGFNLNAKEEVRREVINSLLGARSRSPNGTIAQISLEFGYAAQLDQTIGQTNLTVTQRVTQLNAIMAARAANTALNGYADSRRATFAFSSSSAQLNAEVDRVFDAIKPLYENDLRTAFPAIGQSAGFANSREQAILFSFVYNGGSGLIGPSLKAAITAGDRARAWYEIRYQSNRLGWAQINGTATVAQQREINSNVDSGLAKRRDFESQVFGLFGGSIATELEAQNALRMLTQFRSEIFAYEGAYGTKRDGLPGTRGDRVASAVNDFVAVRDLAVAQPLLTALQPAKDWLVASLNTRFHEYAQQLAAQNFLATNIYLAKSGAPAQLDSIAYETGTLVAANQNDLMIGDSQGDVLLGNAGNDVLLGEGGNDLLEGGAGNDLLIGGEGDDVLKGGAGDDTLVGGAGDDTYVIDLRLGANQHKTIVDSDGRGSFIIYDRQGNRAESVVLQREDGAANRWVDPEGIVTLSRNSPWKITLSDGSVIELGENFDPTGFGITLKDAAAESTGTLAGDTAKAISGSGYTLSAAGYASAGAQAGAADILIGTDASETLLGLAGNDGISAGSGDDLVEGGDGSDLLFGGLGADTLNGGAGDDFIFGSAVGTIDRPTAIDFKPPALTSGRVVAARGFSWLAERAAGERWKDDTASFLGIAILGADASPTFTGPGGAGYSETAGNVIDAGAGNDYVGAGTGADIVHGGAGDDDIYGLNGADVLYGDDGDDFIRGDGVSMIGNAVYTPAQAHGNDILDGGAGNDVLLGQGGDDELFGGANDDQLYGDDTEAIDTPMATHGDDYLDGGDGNDRLEGGGQSDTLFGGSGNDRLWGDSSQQANVAGEYQGQDFLDGEEGDDQLTGGGSDDTLYGGSGNDLLWGDDSQGVVSTGYQGRDYLDGEEGNDQIVGGGNADTLIGGEGNDVMLGDDDMARLDAALHGDDYLDGEGGDDSLYGGGGNDELYGSDGKDYLNGDDDKTQLGYEAHGNDTLDGGAGDDELVGGGGSDLLTGGDGNDVLQGDEVDDQVNVLAHGNDTLDGGEGNDTLFGGGAADQLFGGNGNDQLYGDGAPEDVPTSAHGNDLLDGGEGNDLLSGGGGRDTVLGGAGNDSLYGGVADDALDGGEGDDHLNGGDGNDRLDGGAGFDVLTGGAGNDVIVSDALDYLDGGEGDDTYYIASAESGLVGTYNDAQGTNTVYIDGADLINSRTFVQNGTAYLQAGAGKLIALGEQASLTGMVLKATEAGVGTSAQDIVNRTSANGLIRSGQWNGSTVTYTRDIATAQSIVGTDRAEWLEGGAGIDALKGGGGADLISGGAGADLLYGGSGADTLRGGRGDDTLWAANSSGNNDLEQDIFSFARGDGSDYIRFSALPANGAKDVIRFDAGITRNDIAVSVIFSTDGSNAVPRLTISYGGSDRISLEAGAEGTIEGLQFADGSSMSMSDVLKLMPPAPGGGSVATAGDDLLIGTALADDLRGRGGNDTLIGGGGDDVLQGNDGRNVYQFSTSSGKDLILPTAGEYATLSFTDIDSSAATVRLEGDNLVIRSGVSNSVQVVGFKRVADAPKNWLVQFATGEPVTVEELLLASAVQDSAALGNRRDRFLAQQRVELQTLPQRVFQSGGAVPVALTQTSVSTNTNSAITLPDAINQGTQTFTAFNRYRKEISELVKYVGPVFDNGVAFLSVEALASGNYVSLLDPVPVFGPPSSGVQSGGTSLSNLGQGPLLGYFVRNAWSYSTPQYRVIGYTDEVQTTTTTIAADTANQMQVAGSADNDNLSSSHLAQFRGAIAAGSGNDYVYLNSVTEAWGFNGDQYSIYTRTLASNEDWAPLRGSHRFYAVPPLYGYRERGLGAWVDAGDGDDFVFGTDAADVIIGGRGSDYLNGQAGADTYLIGRDPGSLDRIADQAVFRPTNPYDTYFLYGGRAADFNQDTVEFDAGVDRSRMSYKWLKPNQYNTSQVELHLYVDGELFLQIGYIDDGSAGLAGAAGIEKFVFADGQTWSLAELRAALPQMPSEPPPAAPKLQVPLVDAQVNEDTALVSIDVGKSFVDPQGKALTYQLLTAAGSALPAWLKFDAATGRITGQPGNGDVGVVCVVVSATNTAGLTASDRFEITVVNVNDAPTVIGTPQDLAIVEEGTTYTQVIGWFGDVDANDLLTVSASAADGGPLPAWIQLDPATRSLTAIAPIGETGLVNVRLTATDAAGLSVTTNLMIDVRVSADMVLTGSASDDVLLGHSGDDMLDGGAGADTMVGARGNDTYLVDNAGDRVVEAAAQGFDQVSSSIEYMLTGNVEQLTLTGTASTATGNALDNLLFGNAQANVLDGGVGDDRMAGGLGDDRYIVDNVGDAIVESAGAGTDTVLASVSYALAASVENLTLTGSDNIDAMGNELANVLIGNAGNNRLDGGLGADSTSGGAGDDSYVVDDGGDLVTELTAQGFDRVGSSINYVLTANVEQLTLTGTALYATGNALDNLLFGNDQANVLDGAAGADQMSGGLGDDRYVVDNTGDTVNETVNAGNDMVIASGTYSLAANVENLILVGSTAINGTGNADANVLVGNIGANTLNAGAGNDVLTGGLGNDLLDGGAGDDLYLYNQGEGRDVITDASGIDTLRFGAGMTLDSVAARTVVINGQSKVFISVLSTDGTEQQDQGIELAATGGIERFQFANGTVSTLSDLMIGTRTLNGDYRSNGLTGDRRDDTINAGAGNDIVYGRWGNDIIDGGSGADQLFGEGGNDKLYGGSESDQLWGGADDDYLDGSSGNDQLVGGTGNDQLYGGSDADVLDGGAGNDILDGSSGEDRLFGGAGADSLDGGVDADLLAAGDGNDIIHGGSGQNVVVAGAGNDAIDVGADRDFIDAGAGDDTITTSSGSDFIAAGKGNDTVTTGTDRDLMAFNRGDGADLVVGSGWDRDTLSLGGGIRYADLSLRKNGNDIVIDVGQGDSITFKDWYTSSARRSIDTLQVVTIGGDYSATSTDRTKNRKVVSFDFEQLANRFDAVRVANPGTASWAVAGELNNYFKTSSDTQAIGGDLAYRYATTGSYGDLDWMGIRNRMSGMTGAAWQTLNASTTVNPWTALQAGISLIADQTVGLPSPITPVAAMSSDELAFAALNSSGGSKPSWMAGAGGRVLP